MTGTIIDDSSVRGPNEPEDATPQPQPPPANPEGGQGEDDDTSEALRFLEASLPLRDRLLYNKEVEERNSKLTMDAIRAGKKINELVLEPVLDIPADEMEAFKNKDLWERFKNFASDQFAQMVAAIHQQMDEEGDTIMEDRPKRSGKKKRRSHDSDSDSDADSPPLKKPLRYLRKDDEQILRPGYSPAVVIPEVVKNTEVWISFPLAWCVEHRFRYLCENIEKFPTSTVKIPSDSHGGTNSLTVIDVHKVLSGHVSPVYKSLLECYKQEQPESFGDFVMAINNMIALQATRDPPGESFNRDWYAQHFEGYRSRPHIGEPGFFPYWSESLFFLRTCLWYLVPGCEPAMLAWDSSRRVPGCPRGRPGVVSDDVGVLS